MGLLGQLLYLSVHPNQLRAILQWYEDLLSAYAPVWLKEFKGKYGTTQSTPEILQRNLPRFEIATNTSI